MSSKTPLIGSAWILLCSFGLSFLWNYSSQPGTEAQAPERFPAESLVPLASEGFTLVMLAHPKCPCTRACIRELDRMMTECRGAVTAHVLFLEPDAVDDAWTRSDLWRQARSIPEVSVWADHEGVEAARFGATTSGQVIVYDSSGELVFRGGITPGRGHSGDNFGRSAITALVRSGSSAMQTTPVYGCPIFEEATSGSEGDSTCKP